MFRFFSNKNFYSTEYLAHNRNLTALQSCFRSQLFFLRFRKTLANSMANRLTIHSQYYRSYRNLRFYYVNMLRSNFCEITAANLQLYKFNDSDHRVFKLAYKQYNSIKNLDNALLWRAGRINSLFGIKKKLQKKQKQYYIKQTIIYIKPYKRLLFVWKWLAVFVRAMAVQKTAKRLALIPSFENFFSAPDATHIVTSVKFKIYRLHAIRNV